MVSAAQLLCVTFVLAVCLLRAESQCVHGTEYLHHCQCTTGWNGTSCETAVCPQGCVHGECRSPGSCVCQNGYTGGDCSSEGHGVVVVEIVGSLFAAILVLACIVCVCRKAAANRASQRPHVKETAMPVYMQMHRDGSYSLQSTTSHPSSGSLFAASGPRSKELTVAVHTHSGSRLPHPLDLTGSPHSVTSQHSAGFANSKRGWGNLRRNRQRTAGWGGQMVQVDFSNDSPTVAEALRTHWAQPGHGSLRSVVASEQAIRRQSVERKDSGDTYLPPQFVQRASSMAGLAAMKTGPAPGRATGKSRFLSPLQPQHIPKKIWRRGDVDALSSHFTIGETINRGSSATVRQCTDVMSGLDYAVKVVDKRLVASRSKATGVNPWVAIERELDIQSKVIHRNAVRLKRVFEDDDVVYLVMELLSGGTLLDYLLARGQPLAEGQARVVMEQVLDAVVYLHQQNIMHRDIKMENLVLAEQGELSLLKLVDFGCAMKLQNGELSNEYVGSVQYMAPEVVAAQADKRKKRGYGCAVDCWSCGVLLYAMLTCRMPFSGTDSQPLRDDITKLHISWGHMRPVPAELSISSAAQDLLHGLLCLDPSTRLTASTARSHTWFGIGAL